MEDECQNDKEKESLKKKVKYLEQQLREAQEKLKIADDKLNESNSTPRPTTAKRARKQTGTANKCDKRKSAKNQDPEFPTYEKRSGTSDHGKEYEYLMSGFYALKFCQSESVLDFKMTTNNVIYGDFDDLEITATFKDQTSRTFIIQLKHYDDNKKTVTTKMLTTITSQEETTNQQQQNKQQNNFSLSKYLKSFRTLEDRANTECILSTNINSALKNDSRFTLEDTEIVIKQLKISETDHLLDTTENKSCRIFRFEPVQTQSENVTNEAKEMEEFFKKFYLITNQSNFKAIEASIDKTLDKMLGCKVAFVNFMQHWWKGNFVLSKHDVIAKLSELLLSPLIQEISNSISSEKSELLKNAILNFDITMAKDSDAKIISEIWGNTTVNVGRISKASLKYGITTAGFDNLKKLSSNDLNKALWYLNEVPLIIKFDEAEKIKVSSAIKLLDQYKETKKFLLLGKISRDELPQWRVFETLTDIWNLEVCSKIKTAFKLSLQGREPISLSELIDEDSENAKIIEVKELVIMSQQTFVVARNKEILPESYVSRSVTTTFLNTNAILDSYNSPRNFQENLLIFNCSKEYKEEMTLRHIDTIDIKCFLSANNITLKNKKVVITSSTEECSKWEFDEICKKVKRNVYLFTIIDKTTSILVFSNNNVSILERYKIDRCPIEEEKIHATLKNPLNAITAQPGIGKSTLITYLSKNCPFDHWSVRINLIKYNSLLRDKPTTDKLLSLFLDLEKLAKDSLLYKMITYFLSIRKIYLFLDGLDEIESNCVDLVLNFVKDIFSTGVKVWISSRTNLKELIIKHLKIFPIDINELEEGQQKRYIEKRLNKKFEPNQIKTITTTLLTSADVSNSQQLLGIPLQLYIITENFLNNTEFYNKLDEDIFLLTKMYEIFFNGKRSHQYKKLGVEDYKYQLDDNFDDRLLHYQLPALKSSLDSATLEKLNLDFGKTDKFLTKLKKNGDKFAIISLVTDNNEAVFVHQTYAEYFACIWFKNNLDKLSFIKNEFFLARYQNLKKIFDIMLAEKNPLHLATIYQNPQQFQKYKDKIHELDEGGRSPLHLICSHGEKFKNYFAPYTRETTVYTNMLQELLLKFDPFKCDGLFEWNSLDYALQSQCLYPFEAVLEKHPESVKLDGLLQRLGNNLCAFYCTYFGYLNLLNELLKIDPKIIKIRDHNHRSLLSLALEGYLDNDEMVLKEKNIATFRELAKISNESDKNEAAELACENNDYVMIGILLKNGTNVNSIHHLGMSMLYLVSSLKNTNTEVLQLLLKYGAEINAVNAAGNTALHIACASGNYNAAKFLIENGAEVNYTNLTNETALHFATKQRIPSNVNLVKMLIDEEANLIAVNDLGYTALHQASSYGAYDLVELLLEHNISVNVTTKQQETPLHIISNNSRYDNRKIIERLIDNGVNVDALNKKGYTALHIACQSGNYGTVEVLLDKKADIKITDKENKSVLHFACRNSDTQILKLLIDRGANTNFVDQEGYTPLHEACSYGNYDAVEMLLELDRGADIHKTSNKNETVLHCAAKQEKPDNILIKLLIDNKVEINRKNKDGITALHLVCLSRNVDSIQKLIENGASVDAIDKNGHTPLHLACTIGDYNTIKCLLDNMAPTHALTVNNETVLHMILKQEEPETEAIKLLIDNNADINTADNNGYTPLLLASEHGEYDTIQMLLEQGAEVNAITCNDDTVLHLAVKRTVNKDIMKILIEKSDTKTINTVNKKGESVLYLSYILKCWNALKMLLEKGVHLDSRTESVFIEDFTTILYEGRVELIKLILNSVPIGKVNINRDILPPDFPINLVIQNGTPQVEKLLEMTEAIHNVRQSFTPRYCPDGDIIDYITRRFRSLNPNEEASNELQNKERSCDDEQVPQLMLPVSFMDEMKRELRRKKRNCE